MSGRAFALLAAGALVSCSGDGSSPAPRVPASIAVLEAPSSNSIVGSLAGTLRVRVADRDDRSLSGVVATFSVTAGGSRVTPTTDTTDDSGDASTDVTLGSTPGLTQISVTVPGLPPVRVALTAVAGPTRTLGLNARVLRVRPVDTVVTVGATIRDSAGNITSTPIIWTARDPTLVSAVSIVNNVGVITALRRPGETFVVATSGDAIDSVRLAVHDGASSPCDFVAPARTLALGEGLTVDSLLTCVRATAPGAEYTLVTHYNTAAVFVASRVTLAGFGIAPPSDAAGGTPARALAALRTHDDFELALRLRELAQLPARVPPARAWRAGRQAMVRAATGLSAPARVGDVTSVNVNARDFCDDPDFIGARVVAVTDGTIILADTANPAGGFTAEEYHAFGVAMDTLVRPVDEAAFGAPSDIDENGRVVILFTKAVNALTPRGASGVVQGFFYARDLLPRASGGDACPGSNVAEMFYLLAPDPDAVVSDARAKSDVRRSTLGTIAHEYQHLINASRRMYVTMATQVNEEVWLNEGLSHIAEELVFYRATGRSPRQNIDGSQLALGTLTRELFDQFLLANFRRYRLYVMTPEVTSPFAGDAQLTTRGAVWSYLRYLADRNAREDGDFWYRLVNSDRIGAPNLDAAVSGSGLTATSALADWSIAVMTDDAPFSTIPAYQQPSWNFPSVIPAMGESPTYPLTTRVLGEGQPMLVILQAGGNAYIRFAVPENGEALLQAAGPGTVLPAGMRLTIVRTR